MSFFGGGTDYPGWYRRHGGAALSTTFDKYTYVSCRELPPFFEFKYRIAYSRIENTKTVDEIVHPAIRAVLDESGLNCGLEIHCDADLPARSGLGSSSSFVVGLLNTIAAFKGTRVTKQWLANEAIRIEQDVLREAVGSQDQTAAALGGFNHILFHRDGSITVDPVVLPAERKKLLNDHLMLCFTGFSRYASDVAQAQVARIEQNTQSLHRIGGMVQQALEILGSDQDLLGIGELLHEGWVHKRSLTNRISSSATDNLYDRARRAGAIGGKLLGAGGGGFMLLFAAPERQDSIRHELSELVHVPFQFESSGSQIIHYQP